MQTVQSKPVLTLESVRRVPLDSGGYDTNGRYFGAGRPLFRLTTDDGEEYFARGNNKNVAVQTWLSSEEYSFRGKVCTLTVNDDKYPARDNPLPWQKQGKQETRSGYGRRLTTTREVYYGGRWRRVYCCIFSNSGTCYLGKRIAEGLIVND